MDEGLGFMLVPIFIMVFLACNAQAAVPVSPPESRFVWEPGKNLTFTWTPENFDGFSYDSQSIAGNESLTIKLEKAGSIPKNGIIYNKPVRQTNTGYRLAGKRAVIVFSGEKYLAEYPAGRSNSSGSGEIDHIRLRKIVIDDNTSQTFINGSRVPLFYGHDIEIRDVDLSGSSVLLALIMDGAEVDTKTLHAGEEYIYEAKDGQIIAASVESIIAGGQENSISISRIFQTSERLNSKGDIFKIMTVTDVSETGITLRNTYVQVYLKPGSIIEIVDNIKIKVANSSDFRLYLYRDRRREKGEDRGALHTASNNLTAWDGLNFAGFWYDIDSDNYSESLMITNLTGRRIPEGGLIYTSFRAVVPYAITKTKGEIPPNRSYTAFSLGGNKYAVKNKGLSRILIEHGVNPYSYKSLAYGEIWELGEGYNLTVKSIDCVNRTANLVLTKNGVELDDVLLSQGNAYEYTGPGETGAPKLITYLKNVIVGTIDIIQLSNTWFVSDEVFQIKAGDRMGVFNVTEAEPEYLVLKNMVPVELKAGSTIGLFGTLSFSVENSDELRFYPANMPGKQVMPEGNIVKGVWDNPGTVHTVIFPATDQAGKTQGFEWILAIPVFLAAYIYIKR